MTAGHDPKTKDFAIHSELPILSAKVRRAPNVLAITTRIVVVPLFGADTWLRAHLTIGRAFIGVSLARGYI